MAIEDKIPRANLRELEIRNPRNLRFAQFYVDGEPYLRVSTGSHPIIVESFVNECKRKGELLVESSDFERATQNNQGNPPLRNGRYEAVGFGFLDETDSSKKIRFTGASGTYHLGPNKEHIQKLAPYFPDWKFELS